MNKPINYSSKTAAHPESFWRSATVLFLLTMILTVSQILAACTNRPSDLAAEPGKETILKPGQTVILSSESMKIRFIEIVTDSRCPKGAQCIWAGEVSVLIEIEFEGQKKTMVLTQAGGSEAASEFMGYEISFSVDPYPELNKTIKDEDYRLNIAVSKKPALSGGILATFKVIEEQYSIFVTNEKTIEQILALQRGESNANIPLGRVVRGAKDYNKPWSWYIDPEEISMAEMTVEVSDGLPSYLEDDLDYWVDTVRYFSPWSAELVGVKDYR